MDANGKGKSYHYNMDTQNDSLEKVTPLKKCNFWYLRSISGVLGV